MTMNVSKVWVDSDYVHILTDGGQELRERIADYPRLRQASATALQDYETDRYGISWRALDEDLCFEYFVPVA
ncbi:MAG: DUF2442 domain-containing protein [Bacteroidales bacterium]|nr:DUF2442 domain-containing protein [Bacteroidales bacterium]